jgi:hypothetical protein
VADGQHQTGGGEYRQGYIAVSLLVCPTSRGSYRCPVHQCERNELHRRTEGWVCGFLRLRLSTGQASDARGLIHISVCRSSHAWGGVLPAVRCRRFSVSIPPASFLRFSVLLPDARCLLPASCTRARGALLNSFHSVNNPHRDGQIALPLASPDAICYKPVTAWC